MAVIYVGTVKKGTADGSTTANQIAFGDMRDAVARAAGLTQNADGTWPRDGVESGQVRLLPGTYKFSGAFSSIQTLMPVNTTLDIGPCDTSGAPLPRGQRLVMTGDRTWRASNDASPNTGGDKGSTAWAFAGGSGGYTVHGFHMKDCAYAFGTTSNGSITRATFYDNEATNVQIMYAARTNGSFTRCTFDHRVLAANGTYSLTETIHGYSKAMVSFGTDSATTTKGSCGNIVRGLIGYGGQQGDGFLNGCVLLGNTRATANEDNLFEDCVATALVSPTSGVYGTQGDGFANEEWDVRNTYRRCGVRQAKDASGNRIADTGAGDGGFDIKGEGNILEDCFAEDCKRSVRKHQDDHTAGGGLLKVIGFTSLNPTKHGYDSSGGSAHFQCNGSTIEVTGAICTDETGTSSWDLLAEDEGGKNGNISVYGHITSPGRTDNPRLSHESGTAVFYAGTPGTPPTTVPPPINLQVSYDAGTGRATLTWQAGSPDIQAHDVYERTHTPTAALGRFTMPTTSRVSSVLGNGTYTFSVVAIQNGVQSTEVSAPPLTIPFSAATPTLYRTGGANIFQLAVNDYPSPHIMNHADIDELLDKCQPLNVGLIRAHTLGVSIGSNSYSLVTGVSGTSNPTISYNDVVWEAIDYAVAGCAQRGLYLMVPMTDELGYYHGGKRNWVNFRRPGTCSTDFNVKSANSPAERAAENYFYTDPQIITDFKQYLSDWLLHVNRYTGRANKDEPAVAIIEPINEGWTAAQDAPTWMPMIASHIKDIAPNVLVADGAAADGQDIVDQHLNSPDIDILGTHPYSTFGASDVTRMARQAATASKAFIIGEYGWSKANASAIEAAARAEPNVFTTAFWSLQRSSDLHNGGGADKYGSDDASFYVPGKTQVERDAITRITAHGQSLESS